MSPILNHRMISGTDPQGRQKVFFCCHPDDFDQYFNLVCEDLFAKEECCVVYYEQDLHSDCDRDELLFELEGMQLFVVPVTRRLLTEPSRAIELQLPYALGRIAARDGKRRHIAVLPILVEGGLTDLYNDTEPFGGIQYLDRVTKDETALSYDEKLTRFLQSVLVSDRDEKRIRSEFKAAIFLSYRKVDRIAARKLMERIHESDFCRDVSIWYDEYLVPGESWRKAIDSALGDSDLFVLNVSPNLLEKGNFVWREEYPSALEAGKPILPVMTEDTDEDELRAMYQRIEERLVRGEQSGALEDGLIWGLVKKAGKEDLLTPDNDSEHLYYIGLAYKNSVGVETDADKAILLMEQAGDKGWRRAFLTLGGMYEHGDGVERDEDRAIHYYDQFIKLQTPDFGTSKQGDLDLVLAYDAKGMIYLNRSRLKDAFDTFAELNGLIEDMTSCYGSFKQINLPISYERLGNIRNAMGDPTAAQAFYTKAMQARINPPTTTNIATPEDREQEEDATAYNERHMKQGLAVNRYCLGEICLQNRDLKGAEEHLSQANMLFVELAAQQDDRDLQVNLSKSYIRLAQLHEAQGDPGSALTCYEKALEALESVYRNPHDLEARALHAAATVSLSGWYRDNGRLQRAYQLICDALHETEELIQTDRRPKTQSLLATVYERTGTLKEMMHDTAGARMYYEQDIELSERLVEATEDAEYRRGLAIAYEKLARLLIREPMRASMQDITRAIECLLKDLEITKALVTDEADIQGQRDLSVCYDALCEAYQYWNSETALEYGVKGLVIAYRLAEEIGQPQEVYELGVSYYSIGKLCGDIMGVCFDNALALWTAVYRKTGSRDIQDKIDMLKGMRNLPATECSIEPGYCSGLNELVERWVDDADRERDYCDISPFVGRKRGGGRGEPGEVSGRTVASGCLQLLILLTIVVCGILQATGLVDIVALLRARLGEHGPQIAAGTMAVLYLLTCIRWEK